MSDLWNYHGSFENALYCEEQGDFLGAVVEYLRCMYYYKYGDFVYQVTDSLYNKADKKIDELVAKLQDCPLMKDVDSSLISQDSEKMWTLFGMDKDPVSLGIIDKGCPLAKGCKSTYECGYRSLCGEEAEDGITQNEDEERNTLQEEV